MTMRIRPFVPADEDFILSLVARFTSFPLPPWRTHEEIDNFNRTFLQKAMAQLRPESALLVAEDEEQSLAGFIYLTSETDYFSGEKQGYISDVAVSPGFEGQGVGRLLLEAADDWARGMGYSILYLNVFANNERARRLYEKNGFAEEVVKYVKPLE